MKVDVAALDHPHRRALEEVTGRQLAADQRLIIRVREAETTPIPDRPAQSLADWTSVYAGLTDDEVEVIDKIAKSRANLGR